MYGSCVVQVQFKYIPCIVHLQFKYSVGTVPSVCCVLSLSDYNLANLPYLSCIKIFITSSSIPSPQAPSFYPSSAPSCIFVFMPSTDPGKNANANDKSALLISMIENTERSGFILILLMTSPNYPVTNTTISISHFIAMLLCSAICQILSPL